MLWLTAWSFTNCITLHFRNKFGDDFRHDWCLNSSPNSYPKSSMKSSPNPSLLLQIHLWECTSKLLYRTWSAKIQTWIRRWSGKSSLNSESTLPIPTIHRHEVFYRALGHSQYIVWSKRSPDVKKLCQTRGKKLAIQHFLYFFVSNESQEEYFVYFIFPPGTLK